MEKIYKWQVCYAPTKAQARWVEAIYTEAEILRTNLRNSKRTELLYA